jgi:hypothetical protein
MNKSEYTLQEQIEQKNSDVPFFGTEEGVRNNVTTYNYFPPRSRRFERQTGMINPNELKPKQYNVIEHDFNPCFQTSCNTVFPCQTKKGENCIPLYR